MDFKKHSTRNGNGKPPLLDLIRKLEGLPEARQIRKLDGLPEARKGQPVPTEEEVFKHIVGSSKAMGDVRGHICLIAQRSVPVLVTGETGTGKDMVAAALHLLKDPIGRPFVDVNCAAIHRELAESILFGHERGSFTGAVAQQKGKFEVADGGTLFLDEIAELPLHLQAKILRTLETREIWRIGSNRPITVEIRPIAATARNLDEEVRKGRFREDLLYRLRGYEIKLPSLDERPDDLAILADSFLAAFNQRETGGDGNQVVAADGAWGELKKIRFPGNIRQLRSLIDCAAAIAMHSGEPLSKEILYNALESVGGMRIGGKLAADQNAGRPQVYPTEGWELEEAELVIRKVMGPFVLVSNHPSSPETAIMIIAFSEGREPDWVRNQMQQVFGGGFEEAILRIQSEFVASMRKEAGSLPELARRWGLNRWALYRRFRRWKLAVEKRE